MYNSKNISWTGIKSRNLKREWYFPWFRFFMTLVEDGSSLIRFRERESILQQFASRGREASKGVRESRSGCDSFEKFSTLIFAWGREVRLDGNERWIAAAVATTDASKPLLFSRTKSRWSGRTDGSGGTRSISHRRDQLAFESSGNNFKPVFSDVVREFSFNSFAYTSCSSAYFSSFFPLFFFPSSFISRIHRRSAVTLNFADLIKIRSSKFSASKFKLKMLKFDK